MGKNKSYYYDVDQDIQAYPGAWCFIIVGGRNTGKTYSTLKSCYINKRDFIFIKRAMEDVDMLCLGSGMKDEYAVDLSPFRSINRDIGCNVRAISIRKGIGAFYEVNDEGSPGGPQLGMLLALNGVTKFKGFDMASSNDEQWAIFDEFIPQPWDRVNRKEGEQLMDLYKTVSRDREHRGLQPLKLICLANAVSISNPTTNILEVTDTIAQMQAAGEEIRYIEDRGILIHILKNNEEFDKKEHESPIYKAMGKTAWGQMAFENQFAYNDFSAIGRTSLKGYSPVCSVSYKLDNYYVYRKEGKYYMCLSRHNSENIYNLNRENDQKLFFADYAFDLRLECIAGNMLFETYTMYDLIVNYKKFFQL